ncbi:uncharacterized protein LOC144427128 [Styela clava]
MSTTRQLLILLRSVANTFLFVQDEKAYKNAMTMIADEIAAESGDGEAQIMVEMLNELASMPDEEFNQFMTEQELEQIADSDEQLLRISEKEFPDGQTDEPTPSF